MSEQLTIQEFSRKLLEPKQVDGKWVSTGFDKEIGLRFGTSKGVPSVIENAVHNNSFRLNDNYPPTEGQIALIAKEIEQYAILVVATKLSDDKDRPLVGYRYFWLEKPQAVDIDGVGTLLKWWIKHNQPCLELKPHQEIEQTQQTNYKEGYYKAEIYKREYFEKYGQNKKNISKKILETPYIFILQEQSENEQYSRKSKLDFQPNYNQSIVWSWNIPLLENSDQNPEKNRKSILGIPYIWTIKENPENNQYRDELRLHSLALHLQKTYHRPIAWAWNISCLENPDQFTLICCADEKSYNWNTKENKVSIPLTQELPKLANSEPTLITSSISIKNALRGLAEDKQVDKNFDVLIKVLQESNSIQWDWGQIIDETWLKTHDKSQIAKYKALILLLHPGLEIGNFKITPSDWINSLKTKSEDQETKKKQQEYLINEDAQAALEIQSKLMNYCYQNQVIADQLSPKIYEIISKLLLIQFNEDDKVIEWLFLKSNYFWKDYLKNYGQVIFDRLDNNYKQKQELNADETDDFIKQIIEDLKVWEAEQQKRKERSQDVGILDKSSLYNEFKTNSLSSHTLDRYKRIAQIFEIIKADPIAAFLYQLSTEDIPDNIIQRSPDLPLIIPSPKSQKQHTRVENITVNDNTENSNKINIKTILLLLLSIILGTGIGIILGVWLKLDDKFIYSPISENKSEIIKSDPYFEFRSYLLLLETGDRKQDLQQQSIKNLDNLIGQIPNINDDKLKKEATRTKILKEERKNLTNSSLYVFVKQLTPPVNEKLNQGYKIDQINPKTPLKSPEIKLIKTILKQPLSIYKGQINDTWDAETSTAIKGFQTQYEIKPADGNLGQDTWSLLSVMIQDQQVKQAAEKLKVIIEENNNYKQFQTNYQKLQECKNPKDKVYSDCLKEAFK